MRPVDWGAALSALTMILENPFAERGYEILKGRYEECGMLEEAEALGFLMKERFHADGADAGEGQRKDCGEGY